MRLTVISNVAGCSWAGSEELWLSMSMLAIQRGWHVTALLHRDLHQAVSLREFRSAGGRVVGWSMPRIARLSALRESVFPQFNEKSLGFPDLILVSAGSLPALTYVPGLVSYLRKTSVPLVVLCQFNSDLLQFSDDVRWSVRALLRKASSIVFVSDDNRRIARRQFALSLENSTVIYNPVRRLCGVPLLGRILAPNQEVVFASVARFETAWKAQDVLLEVLSAPVWLSRKWTLRLFGEGSDQRYLESLADFLGLTARVRFEGYIRDLDEIWSGSDILLMPSRGEGTPLAMLEAMMCGRPVVATKVGGIPEVVRPSVDGFLAESCTVSGFAAAMEQAWVSRLEWQRMGCNAHASALAFAQRNPARELLDVLTKALSSS